MFEYGTDMDLASQELTTAVGRTAIPVSVEPTVFAGSMEDMPVGPAGRLRQSGRGKSDLSGA